MGWAGILSLPQLGSPVRHDWQQDPGVWVPTGASVATCSHWQTPTEGSENNKLLEVRSRWHGGELLGAGFAGRESQMEGSRNCFESDVLIEHSNSKVPSLMWLLA